MKTKIKTYKNGAYVTLEYLGKDFIAAYIVLCRESTGIIHNQTICESRQTARAYYKCFCKIAKNL